MTGMAIPDSFPRPPPSAQVMDNPHYYAPSHDLCASVIRMATMGYHPAMIEACTAIPQLIVCDIVKRHFSNGQIIQPQPMAIVAHGYAYPAPQPWYGGYHQAIMPPPHYAPPAPQMVTHGPPYAPTHHHHTIPQNEPIQRHAEIPHARVVEVPEKVPRPITPRRPSPPPARPPDHSSTSRSSAPAKHTTSLKQAIAQKPYPSSKPVEARRSSGSSQIAQASTSRVARVQELIAGPSTSNSSPTVLKVQRAHQVTVASKAPASSSRLDAGKRDSHPVDRGTPRHPAPRMNPSTPTPVRPPPVRNGIAPNRPTAVRYEIEIEDDDEEDEEGDEEDEEGEEEEENGEDEEGEAEDEDEDQDDFTVLSPEDLKILRQHIIRHPEDTLESLCEKLSSRRQALVSPCQLLRQLLDNGIEFKGMDVGWPEEDRKVRLKFAYTIGRANCRDLVFIAQFNLDVGYGWSIPGRVRRSSSRSHNFTISFAISCDGIEASTASEKVGCPRYENVIDRVMEQGYRSLYILNKHQVEDYDKLKLMFKNKNAKYMYLPVHCPDYDPVKLAKAWIEQEIQEEEPALGAVKDITAAKVIVKKAIKSITKEQAKQWFKRCHYI